MVLPTVSVCAQRPAIKENLLIEAFQISRPSGPYSPQRLWIRLRNSGQMEWEEPVWGRANELHSFQLPQARVAAIAKDLNATDWSKFNGKMGPYNVYVDTSVEISIRLVSASGEHEFTVVNPWPGFRPKPLPDAVKRTLCQLQIVRAQASGENKIMKICADTLHALECSEGSKTCVK